MSSDSEDERYAVAQGYTPVLSAQMANSPSLRSASSRQQPTNAWPQEGVAVYQNDLFHDGDVLGGPSEQSQGVMSPGGTSSRPGTAQRMMQAKSGLAARRQERMQASAIEKNDSISRAQQAPNSPSSQMMERSRLAQASGNAAGAAAPQGVPARQPGDSNNLYGLAGSYDPNGDGASPMANQRNMQRNQFREQQQEPRDHRMQQGGGPMQGMQNMQPVPAPMAAPRLDLSDLASFLRQPGPKVGPVQCYIVRDKGSAKMYPKYNLFLEDGKRFLLAARKRKKQTTSNYLISLDYEDLGRDSENYFGKLRSNFVGTDFTVFDNGSKGKDKDQRQELACVSYGYNVLGTRGPRKVTTVIPAVDAAGYSLFKPTGPDDNMLNRIKTERGLDELIVMFNKPPRWNEELNAYCLNFNGRVTEASVKNFQLVTEDNQGYVILQFGKIGRNTFTMDYQWPMSALQAFGICLSSFDNKLACE